MRMARWDHSGTENLKLKELSVLSVWCPCWAHQSSNLTMSNRPCLRIVSGQSYRFSNGSWSECSVITASSASWCGGTYPWSTHVDDPKQEGYCKFQAILGYLWRLSRNRPRFPTLVLSPLAGVKLPRWPQHSHSGEFHSFGRPQVYLATIWISILI